MKRCEAVVKPLNVLTRLLKSFNELKRVVRPGIAIKCFKSDSYG